MARLENVALFPREPDRTHDDGIGASSGGNNLPRFPTGISAAVAEIVRLIRTVAVHDSSVLVLGESGTGKEVVARAIHDSSPRAGRPFVAVNCGAIPAELLESELFGHEKGAFTGAVTTRKGRFEIAEGGTLFLDEIGDMSLVMQVKLLRVLQERMFERVGSALSIRCNVRIIAATHRNLEEAMARGGFREDLFYRLNVFPIEVPALRERLEDMPLLVQDFSRASVAAGRGTVQFSAHSLECLARHPWPGNVRELANLVERLSILCAGRVVTVADLPPRYRPADWTPDPDEAQTVAVPLPRQQPGAAHEPSLADQTMTERQALGLLELTAHAASAVAMRGLDVLPEGGLDLREHLGAIEERLIRQALERSGGTVAHAARLLGLRRTTLVEKLRKYALDGDVSAEVEAREGDSPEV